MTENVSSVQRGLFKRGKTEVGPYLPIFNNLTVFLVMENWNSYLLTISFVL